MATLRLQKPTGDVTVAAAILYLQAVIHTTQLVAK